MRYENTFVRELPGDPCSENRVREVLGACYTRVKPTPVPAPRLVAYSREMAQTLGYSDAECRSDRFARIFGGNAVEDGMVPYAMCYGGHQFGAWAGQLGDGRAISLGERSVGQGHTLELQLKGAGRTPYSRSADGRAVMRSSVREFLCSEAMHHLGVPTTRALSLVATGESVRRDMFYDGNCRAEPGAVVCRVAPTFVRFGNFELFAARGDGATLQALADHVIKKCFPGCMPLGRAAYVRFFEEVSRRTAELIVHWMRVGFVHGVMNTDNMSIIGQTIDYGPYGWVEGFDPSFTPNTTDLPGRRYCFGNQPGIAFWNLVQLANALLPLLGETEPLESALEVYPATLSEGLARMHADKLGLRRFNAEAPEGKDVSEDQRLLQDLQELFARVETDMTLFFRNLARVAVDQEAMRKATDDVLLEPLRPAFYRWEELDAPLKSRMGDWLRGYILRVLEEGTPDEERRARMNAANPLFVPRNYLVQSAIDEAEAGKEDRLVELLEVFRRPYGEQPGREEFARRRPEWARHRPGCSLLSCSS